MALLTTRPFDDVFLDLDGDKDANHIFDLSSIRTFM